MLTFIKKAATLFLMLFVSLTVVYEASAHVDLDYPVGGENFAPGDFISITWHIAIEHEQENWDLYFSENGGETWEAIALDLPIEQESYSWIIPDITTHRGKIRIYMDNKGTGDYEDVSGNFTISSSMMVTAINPATAHPENKELFSNYPNPFDVSTDIEFTLRHKEDVMLAVFNMQGKKVATLVNDKLSTGRYTLTWHAAGFAEGLYFCRLRMGDFCETRRLLLLR